MSRRFVVVDAVLSSGKVQQVLIDEDEYDDDPKDYFLKAVEARKIGVITVEDDNNIVAYDYYLSE